MLFFAKPNIYRRVGTLSVAEKNGDIQSVVRHFGSKRQIIGIKAVDLSHTAFPNV